MTALAAAVSIACILLVPLASIGLALIHTGLGRTRSAAHAMLASLSIIAVASVVYVICGFAWQGYAGRPANVFRLSGHEWDWLAAEPFFFRGLNFDGSPASLAAWLEMFSVGVAALIPLGAAAERWRLAASCASTVLLAGWTYPLFAHWVWGGGWLAQLGMNYGLGRGFIDAGGAGTIHAVGGLSALSVCWILGPRRGKYCLDGMPSALPGHNLVLVLLGCLLAWVGWLGLNGAGAMLFAGAEPGRVVLIGVNTTLSAAAAALASVALTRMRFGRPDASLCANGWTGGLVTSSAACAFVPPAAAILIGALAGLLIPFAVGWLELRLGVDDPAGAISVHAVGGIWGVLAVAVFVPGQWLSQLLGVATLLGFVLPLSYFLNWLLDKAYRQRVSPEGERQGVDLHELGAGAYPELPAHIDDLLQR